MAGVKFQVDIENSSGTKLGSGPLASVRRWRYTSRMDRAGDISFDFAANDPQASVVANRNIARAKALINGAWVEVGAGVIDTVDTSPDALGRVSLSASGMDLIRELSYRTVGELEVGSGSGATHSTALTAIGALAPAGWTFTPAASPDNDYIYARYGGESVLGALVYLAERTQTHFYRSTNRTLVFTSAFADSGVRAIQAYGDLEPEQCAIMGLRRTVDTHDLITRITPYGSGQGAARLTLAATSRAAPSGYTLSAANNYIEHDAAVASYGQIDFPEIEFKEITPISNTDADLQAAANMLFDAALEELTRRATLASQETYSLTIAGCSQLLRPMQTIRVIYRDVSQNIDIDADLYILEATWEIDESGIGTTALVVSTDDRWPVSDVGAAAERAVEGRVFQAHPQLNANSYVTGYTKNVDENEIAAFRFRFGSEVVNLQQVLFEFQILPFESTVSAVGGASSGSGDIPTSTPSSDTTGTGGNNETGSGGPTTTGSETPTIGSATPTVGSTSLTSSGVALEVELGGNVFTGSSTPSIGAESPTIGTVTPTIGSATPTIGTVTPTIGGATPSISATALEAQGRYLDTVGTGLETGAPVGGDVVGSGRHEHIVPVYDVTPGSGAALVWCSPPSGPGSNWEFFAATGNNREVLTTPRGDHTHSVGSHTHSIDLHTHAISSHTHPIASHTHTISTHTHTISSHNHTIAAHTHTIAAHSHTQAAHTHNISGHTHTVAAHTHTVAVHTHTIAAHTHTVSAHTHTITAHTHSLSQHTHTLNNHTHDLSDSITAIYGIFREDGANTYALTDLDYRVNGGSWLNCEDDAVDAGDGWYQIDITSLVQNSTTFRPTAANNLLEIRSLTVDKTATIDAQLSVRNTIQAIAYV